MSKRNARIIFFILNIIFLGIIPSLFIWASGFYSCESYLISMFDQLNIQLSKEVIHTLSINMNNWFLLTRTPFLVFWAIIITYIAIGLISIVRDFLNDI